MSNEGRIQRYAELDSLRGIAAAVVMLFHAMTLWNLPYPEWWRWVLHTPVGLLFSGADAVFLFFVLSGFVLYQPYRRAEGGTPYLPYLVKRVCRIYLPYLVALAFAIVADMLFRRPDDALFQQWGFWLGPVQWHDVWQSSLLVAPANLYAFNGVFWTLRVEMRVSIVFPLVAWVATRCNGLWRGLAVGVLWCLAVLALWDHGLQDWTSLQSLGYAGMFVMGAALARNVDAVRAWVRERPAGRALWLAVMALCLLKAPWGLWRGEAPGWMVNAVHGLGATAVVALVLTSAPVQRMLLQRPLLWLGKVSYSLYLLHAVVLFGLASVWWYRTTHRLLLIAVGMGLSLLLAEAMYRWVEAPSMELGRRLARRMAAPAHAAEDAA